MENGGDVLSLSLSILDDMEGIRNTGFSNTYGLFKK